MSTSESKPSTSPAEMAKANARNREPEVILASKVSGIVKWFSVKSGYGFINNTAADEDVFVHSRRIKYNNPRKLYRTLAEGEVVEFDIIQGDKGKEAINVTGPDGKYVQGSQFAANKPRLYRKGIQRRKRQATNRKNKKEKAKAKKDEEEAKATSTTTATKTES